MVVILEGGCKMLILKVKVGANGETRTPTGLRPLAPEASVYTNFTTFAFLFAGKLKRRHYGEPAVI